ncbi:hypothetical protein CDAR_246001 [Caerostris darwini]|uniref:Uncharacterized protein n=1 Tax=Caerostris darwini TaxID=1538125 RepID=A0AAV4UXD4_9ARAC|nr:hypothetical protein CDAR_246001 [Caerostris darwini]
MITYFRHSITISLNQPTEDHNKKFISSQPRKPYPAEGLPKAFLLVLDSTEWSQSDPIHSGPFKSDSIPNGTVITYFSHSITISLDQPTEDHNKKFISSQPRKPYPAEGLPKAFLLVLDSTEWSQSDPSL